MFTFPTLFRRSVLMLVVAFLLTGSALAAPPRIWQTQNTTGPELSFADCNTKAEQALRSMGLTITYKDVGRIWIASSDSVATTIWCYPLGNGGSVQTFLSAASEGSGVDIGAFQGKLLEYFYGTGGAPQGGLAGRWLYTASCPHGNSSGLVFTVSNLQSDGTFDGEFIDYSGRSTLAGQLQSGRVSFTRRGGFGTQQWSATLDPNGLNMTGGTITGDGGPCSFSAVKQ